MWNNLHVPSIKIGSCGILVACKDFGLNLFFLEEVQTLVHIFIHLKKIKL
jgi:hypothetical protein